MKSSDVKTTLPVLWLSGPCVTCVCKSTSAVVVAGQHRAMLWNGVMSRPLQQHAFKMDMVGTSR